MDGCFFREDIQMASDHEKLVNARVMNTDGDANKNHKNILLHACWTDSNKCWGGLGVTGTLMHCRREYKMVQFLW